ncbi:TetR/AcrR family transcriptional regulator [Paenibacillus albiflavus]|uniref:TetR/AcrR family transcriptional regulator n=1 Tax=Paenibacillus albiflavus TaxID=2545760 RepID=A0A4R4E801_9BACL|nr:TetR/AcrR family transcriptional regulator [Paenibacillus albiflavus]TCZ75267.1 TetR/AcrR family transcriptional regulator [Paenibacillus albiflavus]
MNGFEKRAKSIKTKIMRTTLEMLRTSDPKRIRIADISKTANVSQVTIYNYFGSKELLLREAFISYVDKALLDFEDYMNEERLLKERIEYILFLEKESFKEFPPRLIKEMLLNDHELAKYVEVQYQNKKIPIITQMIEEGKNSGEISDDVTTANVLALIQLYMNQYEMMLGLAEQSGDMDAFFEGMVHMLFYGICGKP